MANDTWSKAMDKAAITDFLDICVLIATGAFVVVVLGVMAWLLITTVFHRGRMVENPAEACRIAAARERERQKDLGQAG